MSDPNKGRLRGLKAKLDGYVEEDEKAREFSDSLSQLVSAEESAETEDLSQWEELRRDIEQYEAEHPELVAILNRIATTLSDMGI